MPQLETRATLSTPRVSWRTARSITATLTCEGVRRGSGTAPNDGKVPSTSRRASSPSSSATPRRVSGWSSTAITRTGAVAPDPPETWVLSILAVILPSRPDGSAIAAGHPLETHAVPISCHVTESLSGQSSPDDAQSFRLQRLVGRLGWQRHRLRSADLEPAFEQLFWWAIRS